MVAGCRERYNPVSFDTDLLPFKQKWDHLIFIEGEIGATGKLWIIPKSIRDFTKKTAGSEWLF
jgi:hypothetical protein